MIKSWIIGITCAAMVVALAETLSPKGPVQKVGRLTGELLLLLAVLQPLAGWKGVDMDGLMSKYQAEFQSYSSSLEAENKNLIKEIIAEKTGAYIVDKAAELGFSCSAWVETQPDDNGTPIPWSVEIRGNYTAVQREALTQMIAADLAIPAQRQSYHWEEVE